VRQIFTEIKKAYMSVEREDLYNNLLEFVVPKKPVRLIKLCLNETYKPMYVNICLIHFLFGLA